MKIQQNNQSSPHWLYKRFLAWAVFIVAFAGIPRIAQSYVEKVVDDFSLEDGTTIDTYYYSDKIENQDSSIQVFWEIGIKQDIDASLPGIAVFNALNQTLQFQGEHAAGKLVYRIEIEILSLFVVFNTDNNYEKIELVKKDNEQKVEIVTELTEFTPYLLQSSNEKFKTQTTDQEAKIFTNSVQFNPHEGEISLFVDLDLFETRFIGNEIELTCSPEAASFAKITKEQEAIKLNLQMCGDTSKTPLYGTFTGMLESSGKLMFLPQIIIGPFQYNEWLEIPVNLDHFFSFRFSTRKMWFLTLLSDQDISHDASESSSTSDSISGTDSAMDLSEGNDVVNIGIDHRKISYGCGCNTANSHNNTMFLWLGFAGLISIARLKRKNKSMI